MERHCNEKRGRRSCASSPACADVVIGHVCLDVMCYESSKRAGPPLRAAPVCQLPSWARLALSCSSACVQGLRVLFAGLSGVVSVVLPAVEGGM